MNFSELYKKKIQKLGEHALSEEKKSKKDKTMSDPVEILRNNGYKIKLITPTVFGTQIDLFKTPDEDEIKKIIPEVQFKIKKKSVFIVF